MNRSSFQKFLEPEKASTFSGQDQHWLEEIQLNRSLSRNINPVPVDHTPEWSLGFSIRLEHPLEGPPAVAEVAPVATLLDQPLELRKPLERNADRELHPSAMQPKTRRVTEVRAVESSLGLPTKVTLANLLNALQKEVARAIRIMDVAGAMQKQWH